MSAESNQTSKTVRLTTALIGLFLVSCFVFGLSYSISTGFAGFEGGLPFAVIAFIVMSMVLYDVWEECIRKRK
ncbi:MAG: hypothetical protein AAF404_00300 [Pseudomonadota bacterium]